MSEEDVVDNDWLERERIVKIRRMGKSSILLFRNFIFYLLIIKAGNNK